MATPGPTIAGSAADLFGVAQAGTLVVQLVFPPNQIPRVSGTAIIAQTAPLPITMTAGTYDFKLWGNDQIVPPDTFYTIKVVDANGNTVQINAYQFTGTGTFDLSSATPYNPPPPSVLLNLQYQPCTPAPPQASGTTYTAPGTLVMVFYNGAPQRSGIDYTPIGTSQFSLNFPTFGGENVYALCVV